MVDYEKREALRDFRLHVHLADFAGKRLWQASSIEGGGTGVWWFEHLRTRDWAAHRRLQKLWAHKMDTKTLAK